MKRGVIPIVALAVLVAATDFRASQAPVPVPASIDGFVVKQGTGDPIPSVDVELTRIEGTNASPLSPGFLEAYNSAIAAGGNSDSALPPGVAPEVQYFKTGPDGKFVFKNLKAGKYKLVAAKIGGTYYPAEYGQRDPRQRGLAFPVADGQALKDLRIEMIQPAAITGRVLDADGEPLGHALVFALDPQYRPGGRRMLNVEEVIPTDERGEYRLHWLVPGPHYVAVLLEDPRRRTLAMDSVPPGRRGPLERAESPYIVHQTLPTGETIDEAYQLVYFGGALDPVFAKQIDAAAGSTLASVDISMTPGKLRAWHIRGVVIDGSASAGCRAIVAIDGTAGVPACGATVRAIPREWSPDALVLNATADMEGVFDIAGAVPGSYIVFATSTKTTQATLTGAGIPPELAAALAAAGSSGTAVVMGLIDNTGIESRIVEVANGNVEKLRMVTSAAVLVPGHVTIEGHAAGGNDPDLAKIRISLTRDPDIIAAPSAMAPLPPVPSGVTASTPRPGNGQVIANGSFTIQTWLGDSRITISGIPADGYVKSIRMGPFDVMSDGLHLAAAPDNPLEVMIGTDGGTINGFVTQGQRDPHANAVVALVPDLPALRRRPEYYQTAASDFRGSFQFQNIPPGDYKVFAWEFAAPDSWQNAEFLQAYESFGKSIHVDQRSKQDVTMTAIPK